MYFNTKNTFKNKRNHTLKQKHEQSYIFPFQHDNGNPIIELYISMKSYSPMTLL
jgi:hypothetical protein